MRCGAHAKKPGFRRFAHEKFLGKSQQQLRLCYCYTNFPWCGKIVINASQFYNWTFWIFRYSQLLSKIVSFPILKDKDLECHVISSLVAGLTCLHVSYKLEVDVLHKSQEKIPISYICCICNIGCILLSKASCLDEFSLDTYYVSSIALSCIWVHRVKQTLTSFFFTVSNPA